MNPIEFEGQTKVLGAPKDWDVEKNGECVGLPVHVANGVCTSVWQPTSEELEALAAGNPVFISIHSGVTQPPIAIGVVG